jgi:hypothetical protein
MASAELSRRVGKVVVEPGSDLVGSPAAWNKVVSYLAIDTLREVPRAVV